MALNDLATLVPGAGNYFTAPVDTPFPADLGAISGPWDSVGHTPLEDLLAQESEGGEATVIGTLQSKSLRTIYSPRTDAFKFSVAQFDASTLRLFYGSNMTSVASGAALGVNTTPTPTVAAFLVVFTDGNKKFAFYAPKAEIFRGDDMSISDTESLAALPLKVTPMVSGSNSWAYAVTPLGGGLPVVATALPSAAVAGAIVTVTGSGFYGATAVKFGAVSANAYTVVSDVQLTAIVPPGTAGSAPVTVVTPSGTSNALAYTRG